MSVSFMKSFNYQDEDSEKEVKSWKIARFKILNMLKKMVFQLKKGKNVSKQIGNLRINSAYIT